MSRVERLLILSACAAMLLAGCGSTSDPAPDDKSGAAWSFTSGNGDLITLDSMPTRIIASGAEAAALMAFGIKPVGIYANGPVEKDANLKDLDLSDITLLGEAFGEIDVEKAIGLKPDLIVADWWPAEKAYSGLEEGTKASSKKIADVAPMVGIAQGDSILELVQGYENLAIALGADVNSPAIAKQKASFEAAQAAFAAAVKAKPDLSVLAVSPDTDLLYVANPATAPELQDFQKWGMDVMTPAKVDPDFPYWENLSWENADKYQPTWKSIKAAAAKSYAEWPAYWMHTYGEYAEQLTKLTAAVEKADSNLT